MDERDFRVVCQAICREFMHRTERVCRWVSASSARYTAYGWLIFYGHKAAHTALVCDCWLCPSPRWVLFFRSSESGLWADAIPSASSTCQMPLLALMADVLLDPVPASARPLCATVHFPASSAVLSQASPQVSLCKSSVTKHKAASLHSSPGTKCPRHSASLGNFLKDHSDQSLKMQPTSSIFLYSRQWKVTLFIYFFCPSQFYLL